MVSVMRRLHSRHGRPEVVGVRTHLLRVGFKLEHGLRVLGLVDRACMVVARAWHGVEQILRYSPVFVAAVDAVWLDDLPSQMSLWRLVVLGDGLDHAVGLDWVFHRALC